jgi:hypothetical protein
MTSSGPGWSNSWVCDATGVSICWDQCAGAGGAGWGLEAACVAGNCIDDFAAVLARGGHLPERCSVRRGASGPTAIPMARPAPEAKCQAAMKASILARRHGRGGGPTLDRAAVIRPSPSQTLLPLAGRHIPRRPLPRQDDVDARPQFAGIAMSYRIPNQGQPSSSYSLACAKFTIARARRTYLLSARSRTVLTASVFSRASASLLDRPKAVSGASTSSANFIGPDSVFEDGSVSELSVKVSRWLSEVRPARARQGRRLAAGHCSEARPWSRVATRSAASLVPARGRLRRRL